MSIDPISAGINPIDVLRKGKALGKAVESGVQDDKSGGFGKFLTEAVSEVNGLQQEADKKIEQMVLGKGATPHEAMVALEKADVAFQLMNQVRSKIVRAYEEVMRTQV